MKEFLVGVFDGWMLSAASGPIGVLLSARRLRGRKLCNHLNLS